MYNKNRSHRKFFVRAASTLVSPGPWVSVSRTDFMEVAEANMKNRCSLSHILESEDGDEFICSITGNRCSWVWPSAIVCANAFSEGPLGHLGKSKARNIQDNKTESSVVSESKVDSSANDLLTFDID